MTYTVLDRTFSSFEEVVSFVDANFNITLAEPDSLFTEQEKDEAIMELENFLTDGGIESLL